MNWFTNLEAKIVTDEEWVVNEIKKGWSAIHHVEQTLIVDVNNILGWIQKNHGALQKDMQTALTILAPIASLVPGAAPAVAAATVALDASQAAIDALSKHVIDGTTPMSAISTSYQTYKDATNAVNTVLKVAASKPTAVSPAAAAAPVPVAKAA